MIYLILAFFLGLNPAFASLRAPEVTLPYRILFDEVPTYVLIRGQDWFAVRNGKETKGILGSRSDAKGSFRLLTFRVEEYRGFELIVNQVSKVVLTQKNDLDAGGPFLMAVTADSKYLVLDYGTASTAREFEVRDARGEVLLKDMYLNDASRWKGHVLTYDFPEWVDFDFSPQAKKCQDVGAAWKLTDYRFDADKKQKEKVNQVFRISCSN